MTPMERSIKHHVHGMLHTLVHWNIYSCETISAVDRFTKFNSIYIFHVAKIMFQFKNKMFPRSSDDLFLISIHNYYTRSAKQFHIPRCRTNIKKFAIRYKGPENFNFVAVRRIQSASTFTAFARSLKYLFSS